MKKTTCIEKIVSHLIACDVTHVVSLDTNNLSVRVFARTEKSQIIFLTVCLLLLLVI